jgi:FixJ family two-component response regulator
VRIKDEVMISLVDDEVDVLKATAGLLRSLGYAVRTFESGHELLVSTDIGETECIIADVMMPEIDGFELQRRIALRGFRFPIIFLTAASGKLTRERLMSGGAFDVLSKPCSQQQLVDSLEAALGQYRKLSDAGTRSRL